jgi:hypothetical protein
MEVAVVLGAAIAVLLHYKDLLHAFAGRFGERDVTAFMQFVLITLVILPILPNEAYGPYAVLNPFQIWLMVVLIVGISLVGYVAYKLFGAREGAVLGGLIGGLISSTATTVSFARRTANKPGVAGLAAMTPTSGPLPTRGARASARCSGICLQCRLVIHCERHQPCMTTTRCSRPTSLRHSRWSGGTAGRRSS